MRVLGTVVALVGLAIVGALVGYALGTPCGRAWVWMLKTSSFEGYSGMLMSLGFAPAGAFIGGLALPGLYLARRRRSF